VGISHQNHSMYGCTTGGAAFQLHGKHGTISVMRPFAQLSAQGQVRRLRQAATMVLPSYGLAGGRIALIAHGFNTTFRVDAPSADITGAPIERYLLRIHQRDHHDPRIDRRQAIVSELAWLSALRTDTTIMAPEPISSINGQLVTDVMLGGESLRYCSLLRWLDGRVVYAQARPRHLAAVGDLMARLHNHADTWQMPSDFSRVRWDWSAFFGDTAPFAGLGTAATWALIPSMYRQTLERVVEPLQAAMTALGAGPDAFGLIHGDLHLENVLFAGREAQPIDFDDCGFGHRVYDMAVALWIYRLHDQWPAYRDAFFSGYARHRPLPINQLRWLDTFIAAREAFITLWVVAAAQATASFRADVDAILADNVQTVDRLLAII
jgi:Ser/Thr protein kinase RdoA (MazF antagonist)